MTDQRVRHEIEQKFKRWEEKHKAKILFTPIDSIPWSNVVKKAIWREPPFVLDSQNTDNEKGFRDCLILETIKHFCFNE